jgi:hypothetical protein
MRGKRISASEGLPRRSVAPEVPLPLLFFAFKPQLYLVVLLLFGFN